MDQGLRELEGRQRREPALGPGQGRAGPRLARRRRGTAARGCRRRWSAVRPRSPRARARGARPRAARPGGPPTRPACPRWSPPWGRRVPGSGSSSSDTPASGAISCHPRSGSMASSAGTRPGHSRPSSLGDDGLGPEPVAARALRYSGPPSVGTRRTADRLHTFTGTSSAGTATAELGEAVVDPADHLVAPARGEPLRSPVGRAGLAVEHPHGSPDGLAHVGGPGDVRQPSPRHRTGGAAAGAAYVEHGRALVAGQQLLGRHGEAAGHVLGGQRGDRSRGVDGHPVPVDQHAPPRGAAPCRPCWAGHPGGGGRRAARRVASRSCPRPGCSRSS